MTSQEAWATPPVDIVDAKEHVIITAELPGVKRDDIELEWVNNTLNLKAHRPARGVTYRRHFRLGTKIDGEAISADLKNGLLRLTLPRTQASGPRKIEVSSLQPEASPVAGQLARDATKTSAAES